MLDLLRPRVLGGQLLWDTNYSLFKPFFLWKLKPWGAPLGREGLCHLSVHPSTGAGEHHQLLQQRCEHGPWLGTGFSHALLLSVTCLSAGNPFSGQIRRVI